MAKKKRKLNIRNLLLLILLLLIIILVIIILTTNFHFLGKKSVHEDAKTYKTSTCLAFYPDSDNAREKVSSMCKDAPKNTIYDYALIPYGDYYLVSYFDGTEYYVDSNYNELVIDGINDEGKKIVSDYLRYEMKKDELDIAYTYDFLNDTYYTNLDLSDVTYKVEGTNLVCHFPKYDYDVKVPLKYMQEPCGINLGYTNEYYEKPRYVSNNRKMICFTFDDGPDLSFETSGQVVDTLYKFDSSGTFFILGNRLGEKQINYCKESVEKGMEYGSHTQSHANLTKLSVSEAANEILTPYHDLCDNEYGFGYQMKVFRPPYGAYNSSVGEATNLTAVLWNVDSLDWSYRTQYEASECVEVIYNKVVDETDENDVVLFHDIYQTSADAACKLIEHYINEGYQIVNASELMEALGETGTDYFAGK